MHSSFCAWANARALPQPLCRIQPWLINLQQGNSVVQQLLRSKAFESVGVDHRLLSAQGKGLMAHKAGLNQLAAPVNATLQYNERQSIPSGFLQGICMNPAIMTTNDI